MSVEKFKYELIQALIKSVIDGHSVLRLNFFFEKCDSFLPNAGKTNSSFLEDLIYVQVTSFNLRIDCKNCVYSFSSLGKMYLFSIVYILHFKFLEKLGNNFNR